MKRLSIPIRFALAGAALGGAYFAGGAVRLVQDSCGPFTDVSVAICPYVAEAYYVGITAGTSSTTFSPDVPITRGQAAVFTTKALNQSLARSSRRAALGQWWTTTEFAAIARTPLGAVPGLPACDGSDIWVPVPPTSVARVRGSDGRILETWAGVTGARSALVAMGRVFVIGDNPSNGADLYVIDPSQPPGTIYPTQSQLLSSGYMAFDGGKLWTVNNDGTLSYFTPSDGFHPTTLPGPVGRYFIVFDGTHLWVPSQDGAALLRLDLNGNVLQTVHVSARCAVFDGANLWLGSFSFPAQAPTPTGWVSVVQASTGKVLAVLAGNGMTEPFSVAFDGQRIMVTNDFSPNSASLWDASSLQPLGYVDFAGGGGVCSDGINFWIAERGNTDLARF